MYRIYFILIFCLFSQFSKAQLTATFGEETYRTEMHPFSSLINPYTVSDKKNEVLYVVQNLKPMTPRKTLSSTFSIEKYDKSGKRLVTNKFDFSEKKTQVGIQGLLPMVEKLFICLVKYTQKENVVKITLIEIDKNSLKIIGEPIIVMSHKLVGKYGSLAMDVVQSPDQSSLAVIYYPSYVGSKKVNAKVYFLDALGKSFSKKVFQCRGEPYQDSKALLLTNEGTFYLSYIWNRSADDMEFMMNYNANNFMDYAFELIGVNSTSNSIYNYKAKDDNIQLLSPTIALDKANNLHLGSIALKKKEHKSGLYKEVLSFDLISKKDDFVEANLIYEPKDRGSDQAYLRDYSFDQIVLEDGRAFFIYELWTQETSYISENKTRVIDNFFDLNILPFTNSYDALAIKIYPKFQRTIYSFSPLSSYSILNKGTEAYVLYNGRRGELDNEEKFKMNLSTKNDLKYIKLADKCYPVKTLTTPNDHTKVSTRLKGGPFYILDSEWKSRIMFLD